MKEVKQDTSYVRRKHVVGAGRVRRIVLTQLSFRPGEPDYRCPLSEYSWVLTRSAKASKHSGFECRRGDIHVVHVAHAFFQTRSIYTIGKGTYWGKRYESIRIEKQQL